MSRVEPVLIGGLYFVTRRTLQGMFRLRPDPYINQLVEYCLAVASIKYGVGVVGFVVQSNHWHAILLDRKGNHRQFVQWVDSMIARALNRRHGTTDTFWSSHRNPPVLLCDWDAVLRMLVYLIANPVAAKLVEKPEEWPGFITLPNHLMTLRSPVSRPLGFFREDNLPDQTRLRLINPCLFGFRSTSGEQFRDLVTELVTERVRELNRERRKAGQKVLGRVRILAQDVFATPSNPLPSRRTAPRVATRDTLLRLATLKWIEDFVEAHRKAFERLRDGIAQTIFPFGTDLMRRIYGFKCQPRAPDFPVCILT